MEKKLKYYTSTLVQVIVISVWRRLQRHPIIAPMSSNSNDNALFCNDLALLSDCGYEVLNECHKKRRPKLATFFMKKMFIRNFTYLRQLSFLLKIYSSFHINVRLYCHHIYHGFYWGSKMNQIACWH